MKKLVLTAIIFGLISSFTTQAQVTPKDKGLQAITPDLIKGQLEFLSSDWMEGRATGEKGFYLASDYVASMFRVVGVSPAGDAVMGGRRRSSIQANPSTPPSASAKTYFQNFTLIESQPTGGSTLTIKKGGQEYTFKEGIDFSISRATMEGKFDAPVVFVGYGIQDKANGIDDFAGVDVKGKVVLRLSGFPGSGDNTSPMYKKLIGDNMRAQFEMQRKKSDAISKIGVLGVIELTINTDAAKGWGTYKFNNNMAPAESRMRSNMASMRLDGKEITSNPVTVTITERVSNLIIKEGNLDIAKYEKEAAAGTVKFKPVIIPGLSAGLNVSVNSKRVNVRNVIAIIEGENPNEYVAVGAHLDHMGMDNGKIWNGADDNASGTVAVMTLAKAFAASGLKPKRSIVFCAWTGEEEGLLGSEYFTVYPAAGKISDYKFYLNFDMISRDATNDTEKNMAGFTYTKAFPKIEEMTKKLAEDYKINLKLDIKSEEQPRGGSDFEAFAANNVPIVEWMAAMHSDYHQASDEVSLVNWNKMLEIIKLGYLQVWEAANGEIK
ncbi:MAG: M20/M25/M40 family metallo-hydrolase [Bacteroidia bacterium]|nr:M20/M25/M40 family metallo-hydrolase [Bacteroidia bacterium]